MIKLRYGNTNTYFIDGLLIDTDMPDTLPALYRELKRNGLSVNDVKYVMVTHCHPDHIGLVRRLMTLGVKFLLIDRQIAHVHFSDPIFAKLKNSDCPPIREDEATVISCAESRIFLRTVGICGELVPTDSHSPDGVALITDDGYCFVGDLEPAQYTEAYGEDSPLKRDWERIAAHSPRIACFGHINDQML